MGTGVDNVDDEEKVADPDAWHSWKPRVFKEVQMQYRHLLVGPDPEEAWQAARHSAVERSYCRMCIKRPRRAETETLGFFLGEEDGFRDDGMVEPFQPPQERAGASCCIRVSEHWGVGPLLPSGNPSLRGAAVWIYLVLHEVTNEPLPLEHPDDTSRLDFARRKKEQGNLHFAKGDVASLARAVRRYASGAAAAEAAEGDEAAQLLTMMCLNGAQAQLRRGRFEEAIQLCDRVLGTGPNIKDLNIAMCAFFRRAAAREALGDYLGAEEDLRTAAKRSDDPALRQQLAKVQGLRQQQKEQQRQAYGGVFEKMKLQDEEKEKKEKEASERRAKEAQKEAEERAKEAQRMQAQEQERTQEEQAKATVESLMKALCSHQSLSNLRLAMAKPDEEKLREELKVLLQAQAEWAEELQELSLRRDAMMQKAQAAEAAVEAERQAMDDLERECHSFDLRKRQANEEEANSQSLAENISAELQTFGPANISTESRKGGKGGKNGKGKGKACFDLSTCLRPYTAVFLPTKRF
eukprot:g16166.t1